MASTLEATVSCRVWRGQSPGAGGDRPGQEAAGRAWWPGVAHENEEVGAAEGARGRCFKIPKEPVKYWSYR